MHVLFTESLNCLFYFFHIFNIDFFELKYYESV